MALHRPYRFPVCPVPRSRTALTKLNAGLARALPLPVRPAGIQQAQGANPNPAAGRKETNPTAFQQAPALQFRRGINPTQPPAGPDAATNPVGSPAPPPLDKAIPTAPAVTKKKKDTDPKATQPAAKGQSDEKSHPAHAPAAPTKAEPIPAGSFGPSALPLSGKVTPTAFAVAKMKKTSDSKTTRPGTKGQNDKKSHPVHAPAAPTKAKLIPAGSLGL